MSGPHREQGQRAKPSPSNDDHNPLPPDINHPQKESIGSEVRDLAGTSGHRDDMLWVPEDSKMNIREQGGESTQGTQRGEVKQEHLDVNLDVHQGSASAAMNTDSEDGDWLPRSKKKAEKRRLVKEKKGEAHVVVQLFRLT